MQISAQDARALFTQYLADFYREMSLLVPTGFLQSFFTEVENSTLTISLEVERGYEKVAVDVARGTEGNRNDFSNTTYKQFKPPYYREWFDKTDLALYDRLIGSTDITEGMFVAIMEEVADKLVILQKKIMRAYELQCAQVFETGIVTLNEGINIDFKRKAGSLVNLGAGNYWASAVNPYDTLEAGANFVRQTGKAQGGTVNVLFGSTAWSDFLKNATVLARADIRNFQLDNVRMPQRNSVGASLMGEVAIGSYRALLWTYPEFYDNANNVSTPYMNPKKVVVLPEAPRFKLAYAAVPQLIDEDNPTPKKGRFVIDEYKDPRKVSHVYDVKSAGVAIPVAVDQIYTVQVVA